MIYIEAACHTIKELDEDVQVLVAKFDQSRREKGCLP